MNDLESARRFQFSISSLLLFSIAVAIALGWWRDHRQLSDKIDLLLNPGPRWDTDQVTGPPDTASFGDLATAWASKTPDGQREWLVLDYAQVMQPTAVRIHETYNPGAVTQVSAFRADGSEVVVWTGQDPTPPSSAGGVSVIPVSKKVLTRRIKIYLDSPAVPGWNEIDAVGLRDARGRTQWAERAFSSSSFGRHNRLPPYLHLIPNRRETIPIDAKRM